MRLLRPLRDVPTDCQEAVREAGELRWVNPLQDRSWDQLLHTHRGANVFHTAGWAEVLTETYGFAPFYLVEVQGECLQSLMGIMEVNSWWTGKRGVSLPMFPELTVEEIRTVVREVSALVSDGAPSPAVA